MSDCMLFIILLLLNYYQSFKFVTFSLGDLMEMDPSENAFQFKMSKWEIYQHAFNKMIQ